MFIVTIITVIVDHHHHHNRIACSDLGLVTYSVPINSRKVFKGVVLDFVPHLVDITQFSMVVCLCLFAEHAYYYYIHYYCHLESGWRSHCRDKYTGGNVLSLNPGKRIFGIPKMSRPVLGPTQRRIRSVLVVKRTASKANPSVPC
jgi:hypothetical protein